MPVKRCNHIYVYTTHMLRFLGIKHTHMKYITDVLVVMQIDDLIFSFSNFLNRIHI